MVSALKMALFPVQVVAGQLVGPPRVCSRDGLFHFAQQGWDGLILAHKLVDDGEPVPLHQLVELLEIDFLLGLAEYLFRD